MTTAGAGRPVAAAAVLAVAAGLTGCANDQQRTRTEGAGIGAVLGAVVGHALGGRDGAIAGAAIGGVAGGVAGDKVANKKRQYADREDALKTAAAQSRAVAQRARDANEALQRDVASLEGVVNRLQGENLTARNRTELAAATRRSFQETNGRLDQQLAAVRQEIGRQQQVIVQEQQAAQQTRQASPPELRLVSAGVDELRTHERALERAKAQLAQLDSRRAF